MNPLKNPENSHIIDNVLVDDIFFQVWKSIDVKVLFSHFPNSADPQYPPLTRGFSGGPQAETRELGQQEDNWRLVP